MYLTNNTGFSLKYWYLTAHVFVKTHLFGANFDAIFQGRSGECYLLTGHNCWCLLSIFDLSDYFWREGGRDHRPPNAPLKDKGLQSPHPTKVVHTRWTFWVVCPIKICLKSCLKFSGVNPPPSLDLINYRL